MKTTTVPAQVTTVEDKIAGNLTLTQIMLFIVPLLIGAAIYLIIPPIMHLTILKFAISLSVLLVFSAMAIRIKGKILLMWAIIIITYNSRPRYFVFNKNDVYLRNAALKDKPKIASAIEIEEEAEVSNLNVSLIPLPQRLQLETILADPRANLHFRTNHKGGLSVHITEIK